MIILLQHNMKIQRTILRTVTINYFNALFIYLFYEN